MKPAASFAVVALLLSGATARAQVDIRRIGRAAESAGWRPSTAPRVLSDRTALPTLIELGPGEDASIYGLRQLAPGWSAARASVADLVQLSRAHPSWHVTWSPPRHPLLDQAGYSTRAVNLRNQTGRSGRGVFIGMVDTGIDPFHPDFRNPDGTTRIAYLVDFSQGPLGKHPDAEQQCPPDLPCAVFSRTDIDTALAANDRSGLPGDAEGHGTHVASLAAGNGGAEGKYVGIAPGADLIVVKAADAQNTFSDDVILAATQIVFWLAEQEGRLRGLDRIPAVVNLSLGGVFGPHDGTAPLERALGALVGPDHPGRAIVVAAGNEGGLYSLPSSYPNPRGVHAEVHVPQRSLVRVPIVIDAPANGGSTIDAAILVWIALRPGDEVSTGLDRHGETWIPPRPSGAAESYPPSPSDLTATILNGTTAELGRGFEDANAAVIAIEGTWPRNETFAITLEGHGTAALWIESYGDLDPHSGGLGALFPRANKESTIAIPASHPNLIAVGATLNRTSWKDRAGDPIAIHRFGSLFDPDPESLAFFSSSGPTSDGRLKPDLVAPGALIAGAMGFGIDPATNPDSMFATPGFCQSGIDCAVVDDDHAISAGTSMAAPLVSGAAALLFEAAPNLTADRILIRLQAGARYPTGTVALQPQLGAGTLDLLGALDIERLEATPEVRTPVPETTWLTLGASYAHPDPGFSVPALLHLRDANARAAAGIDISDLEIDVRRGRVSAAPRRLGPGLVSFSVAANSETGGDTLELELYYRGQLFSHQSLPIAVDVNVEREGFMSRGGCTVGARPTTRDGLVDIDTLAAGAVIVSRGRRRRSGLRKARNPGRKDTTGPGHPGSFRR